MSTDPRAIDAGTAGNQAAGNQAAGNNQAHLSTAAAKELSRDENDEHLKGFVAALDMQRAVGTDKAARLLEHIIKEAMSANVEWLEGQMRTDGWESCLAPGETLTAVAERAHAYLESPAGLELFNLFTKTFARTTGEIFD